MTFNLCASHPGQAVFGAVAELSKAEIAEWYAELREYYKQIMVKVKSEFAQHVPDLIVSTPAASIYLVIDWRQMRISFVESPENMAKVPALLAKLYDQYQASK